VHFSERGSQQKLNRSLLYTIKNLPDVGDSEKGNPYAYVFELGMKYQKRLMFLVFA